PDSAQTAFTYDATGNRLTRTDANGTTNYSYDTVDQLTNAGDGRRLYDANGQLLSVGSQRGFTWDARQQLASVVRVGPNTAPVANAGTAQTGYVNRLILLDG